MSDVAPPLRDGRYRLVAVLGAGGMAVVYRGQDTRLRVERAIKVLAPNLSVHPQLRRRFEDEATTMAQLRHPNIVTVHDVDEEQDRPFIVMELLEGGSLRQRFAVDPLAPREACWVVRQVLAGLSAAHAAGVVHRDVKPTNILLDRDGTPKLTDFGIARVQTRTLTSTGEVIGTYAYMSPEQGADGTSVDARSDVYSAGLTLLAAVTGRDPQLGFDLAAELEALRADLPALADVIGTATRAEPADRYPSAAAFADALEAVEATLHGPARPAPLAVGPAPVDTGPSGADATFVTEDEPPAPAPVAPAAPRRWARLGVAAVGVVAVVAISGWWLGASPDDPETRDLVRTTLDRPRPAPRPADPVVTARTPPPAGPSRVVLVGDTPKELWLDGPDGRVAPGELPAGSYTVWVRFDEGPLKPSGRLELAAGATLELRCDAGWRRCRGVNKF